MMRSELLAHLQPIDRVDMEALDAYLSSDRAPAASMTLSVLDGFLTGVAIGPEMVMPSEWMPLVWDEEPLFSDQAEAEKITGSIIGRYNEILLTIEDETFTPIIGLDRDGLTLPFDWADGFLAAMGFHAEEWMKLTLSQRHGHLLIPILALCSDEKGHGVIDLPREAEEKFADEAGDFIPDCVIEIAAYWRRKQSNKKNQRVRGKRARSS